MNHPQKHPQSGFSMVEVLVAVVVLSVGLLGMAGLYVTTLRSGSSSISRMQAVYLASDIADRIRANRNAKADYAAAAGSVIACETAVCDPTNMAANDLLVWNTLITRQLPNGTGVVAVDTTTVPTTYTITLTWNDPGSTVNQTYQLVTQI